MVIQPTVR